MEQSLITNQQNQVQLDEIVDSSKVEMTHERVKGGQSVMGFLQTLVGFIQLTENEQEDAGIFLGDHYNK